MRRLEELVGAPLVKQTGRTLLLTSEGEMLLSYAREILRLNDEAASYFNRSKIAGVLRVGLPNDYAVAFLQGMVTEYTRQHPEISLRSEEHTSELQSLMRISYAVFCFKNKKNK